MNNPDKQKIKIQRRGLMLIMSSPSGAGKTTISRALLETDNDLAMSISVTTRPPRPGEVDGKDYYFVTEKKFQEMVEAGEFLEHATVFDNSYGTPRKAVMEALEDGRDVLFDVDWQGTQQLKQNARDHMASIFILPPSKDELERRLYSRAQDSEEVIKKRMSKAASEMSHWAEYDYIVVNDVVEDSVAEVKAILKAERLKRDRRVGLPEFVSGFSDEQ